MKPLEAVTEKIVWAVPTMTVIEAKTLAQSIILALAENVGDEEVEGYNRLRWYRAFTDLEAFKATLTKAAEG